MLNMVVVLAAYAVVKSIVGFEHHLTVVGIDPRHDPAWIKPLKPSRFRAEGLCMVGGLEGSGWRWDTKCRVFETGGMTLPSSVMPEN